jgi:hypothetical protein
LIFTPESLARAVSQVEGNFLAFAQRLQIVTAHGEIRSLIANPAQTRVIEALERKNNVVVVKARQLGITTICAAYLFWRAYVSETPTNTASILHKMEASKEVFTKVTGFYESIPAPIRRKLHTKTASQIKFKKSKASYFASTAGGHGGLRSFSLHLAHLSELCFYDDPEEVLANTIAALNGNQIVIESTCQQYGDAVHSLVDRAQKGELPGQWELLFFPWHEHADYAQEPPVTWKPNDRDVAYGKKYKLTDAQLFWRSQKILEIGIDKFKTEYPSSLEELFEQRSGSYYTTEDLENTEVIPSLALVDWEITPPVKGEKYGIGVDVSAGVGRDYSVAYVMSKKTRRPVYVFRSNEVGPVALARRLQHLARHYNDALVLVESNSWGLPVLNELRHLGGVRQWMKAGKPWTTTAQSKLLLHEELKAAIRRGEIPMLDYGVVSELRALALPEPGSAPESVQGARGHSDAAMALGLAWQCLKALPEPGDWLGKMITAHKIQTAKAARQAIMLPR